MGRILRKKTTRKKQKQDADSAAETLADGSADEKKATSLPVPAKDDAKKQGLPQKKAFAAAKAPTVRLDKGYIGKGLQFLREVKVELKKVTWPTRKQTLGSTAVVIVLVMIISLFLGIVDFGLSNLVRVVLH